MKCYLTSLSTKQHCSAMIAVISFALRSFALSCRTEALRFWCCVKSSNNMTRKCSVPGCRTGYQTTKEEKAQGMGKYVKGAVFGFPRDLDLCQRWEKFLNRKDFFMVNSTVGICIEHFEQRYLKQGEHRTDLNYSLQPVPTIHTSEELIANPSLKPILSIPRKPPTKRTYTHPLLDETDKYLEMDTVNDLTDITPDSCPPGFSHQIIEEKVVLTNISFLNNGGLRVKTISIDADLHVKLHFNSNPVPLPSWFRDRRCKLTRLSMLDNLSSHIDNTVEELGSDVLLELQRLRYYKPCGRPQYSNNILKFALMQRYTSRQAYEMLLDELPLPSLSFLKTLAKGGIEPVEALKVMLEEDKVSCDCALLIDEMILQKDSQYHGGGMHGMNEHGEFYTGVVAFMVVGLNKESIPFVVKACPVVNLSGEWLMEEIEETLKTMEKAGFNVRTVIPDNHSTNVLAFKLLREKYGTTGDDLSFVFNGRKVYTMFDSVHLVKNIRNNLLSAKRFIFPEFEFDGFYDKVSVPAGDLSWHLLHKVHEKDLLLKANLRKARKLNAKTLHPGNKKQNVQLALNIFDETTVAGILRYFPEESSAAGFLKLINTWWTLSNSKTRINTHHRLGNAAVRGDKKPEFLREFATWIETWQKMQLPNCARFMLSPQTSDALITTLRATASLIEDLFKDESYHYILTARLQTDPLERHFGKVRQMSGGRFLVGLREFQSSEKIICMKSLLKAGIECWDERVKSVISPDFNKLHSELSEIANEVEENSLCEGSREVAIELSGYVVKKLLEKSTCDDCKTTLKSNTVSSKYLDILNRGGLLKPNESLAEYVCSSFSILDTAHDVLMRHSSTIRDASMETLKRFLTEDITFMCSEHGEQGRQTVDRIITNIYFNNEQKIKSAQIRKDKVVELKKPQRKKRKCNEN